MAGISIQYAALIVARYDLLFGDNSVVCGGAWPFRNYPSIIALFMLTGGLTVRWVSSWLNRGDEHEYRGKKDRRKIM
jgi:hypothetical protein